MPGNEKHDGARTERRRCDDEGPGERLGETLKNQVSEIETENMGRPESLLMQMLMLQGPSIHRP